jgi:segregation and condensation protein B
MSLKAKVEAVVYAAEEPVTLAQLAATFANEVLEQLAAAPPDPPVAPNVYASDASTPNTEAADATQAAEAGLFPNGQEGSDANASSKDGAPEAADGAQPDGEAAEKKAARQRERTIREALQRILNQLIAEYAGGDRGMEIREVAGGYRMATKPEYHDAVRGFVKTLKPPMKLSLQALETLAVIAYKQPVTAPEVNEIRGVDSGGVLGSLIGRKLITTAGRKQVIGRPILYRTTKEFLLRFGLKDLSELPSMEEFEKMAGELAEAQAEAEDAAMRSEQPEQEGEAAQPLPETEPLLNDREPENEDPAQP